MPIFPGGICRRTFAEGSATLRMTVIDMELLTQRTICARYFEGGEISP